MVNISVVMSDGAVRKFPKMALNLPSLPEGANKWMELIPKKKGEPVLLNFSAYSIRETVPEKVRVRKSDGEVLDNGQRVTGSFVSVTITKEGFLND